MKKISSSLPDNAFVHIDKIKVVGPCHHALLGSKHYRGDPELGIVPSGAYGLTFPLRPGGGTVTVKSRNPSGDGTASLLEFWCCPPKVLQRQNVFGHGALMAYDAEIFERTTQRLGLEVSAEERECWRAGRVWLTEAHLTANFRCPRDLIVPIIDAIDRSTSCKKSRPLPTWIILGSLEAGRSKHHTLGLYDKLLQLLKEEWKTPGPVQQRILDFISDAIRAEIKLRSMGLNYRGLQYVANWENIDVSALYFELLDGYSIQHAIQAKPSAAQLESFTRAEQRVYKALMSGESLESMFNSRSTVKKYRDTLNAKTGVVICGNNHPEDNPPVDTRDIFRPENVVPVPGWMLGTDMFWQEPQKTAGRAYRGIGSVHLPANLPPDRVIEVDGELRVI